MTHEQKRQNILQGRMFSIGERPKKTFLRLKQCRNDWLLLSTPGPKTELQHVKVLETEITGSIEVLNRRIQITIQLDQITIHGS